MESLIFMALHQFYTNCQTKTLANGAGVFLMMQEANYTPAAYSVFIFHLIFDIKISERLFPKRFASVKDRANSFLPFRLNIINH
jgi:hypothetical protein